MSNLSKILTDRLIFSALSLAVMLGTGGPSRADPMQDYAIQAIRTLNFARFTEWSASALKTHTAARTLCVLGNKAVHGAFNQIDKQQLGGSKLRIVHLYAPLELRQCDLVFIGDDEEDVPGVLGKVKNQPILTIGTAPHFLRDGGMVQLWMGQGEIKMGVNLRAVRRVGLRIDSKVLKLARIHQGG